ncbi:MAG: hypothetical protein K8U03_13910, partial [Planctomycetia bacterium]|nr:hypothetical protein [Planctomycetia bacterium]
SRKRVIEPVRANIGRTPTPVNFFTDGRMGRHRKPRRNQHGSARHWRQTHCWYYMLPGTKKRMLLFDEQGGRARGKEGQRIAEHALARAKLLGELNCSAAVDTDWIVARACSEPLNPSKK